MTARPCPAALGMVMVGALAFGEPAQAQLGGHIDAGSGSVRMGAEAPWGALRLAPSVHFSGDWFRLAAVGDYAGHSDRGWQSTGRAHGQTGYRFGWVQVRAGFEGAWSRTRWSQGAGGLLGLARLEAGSAARGFALEAGTGRTFSREGTQPLSRLEMGGWNRIGQLDLGLWLKRTGLVAPGTETGISSPRDSLGVGGPSRRTLPDHYTDLEATVGWSRGKLALEGGAGRRIGRVLRVTSWYLQGQYQIHPRLALVASSGQFPVDLVSGLPSGAFTTLSLRLGLGATGPAPEVAPRRPSAGESSFVVTEGESGTTLLLLRVPLAATVELMGDFTAWAPVPLVPNGDATWRYRAWIDPGLHHLNIRINGGPWIVPPGLPGADDGLGGRAGIFVVN